MKPKTFRDLKVWQLAHKLSLEVSQLGKAFPSKEIYRLVDQMIRAARSAPANILGLLDPALNAGDLQPSIVGSIPLPVNGIPLRREKRNCQTIAEGFGRFHYNDKLTFYERASSSLGELDNHFAEALGNKYITETVNTKFIRQIKEISFLLRRMMRNIKLARDNSSQRLNSSPRLNSSHRLNSKPSASS